MCCGVLCCVFFSSFIFHSSKHIQNDVRNIGWMFCIRDKFTLIDFQRKQIVNKNIPGIIQPTIHCKNIKLPLTTHIILIQLLLFSSDHEKKKNNQNYWTEKNKLKCRTSTCFAGMFHILLLTQHYIHFNFDWLFHLERIYCLYWIIKMLYVRFSVHM